MKFQIACNEKTSYYEVHIAGCRHLAMGLSDDWRKRKFAYVNPPVEAGTAAAAAAEFEAGNEGCLTKLGACAR